MMIYVNYSLKGGMISHSNNGLLRNIGREGGGDF